MMRQYQEAKACHPDMLLLFRMGDFYELFYEDAEKAARLLQLTLTSRDGQIPMAGFPHHQLEAYLRKLLHLGERVAICEQVEDPSTATGLVRREVVRVVTPGTVTEDTLLDPLASNHLAACVIQGDWAGLAWVESSTGSFHAHDVPASRLAEELSRIEPRECLWPEEQALDLWNQLRQNLGQVSFTPRPVWTFEASSALQTLTEHFGVKTLEGFGFSDSQICLRAAAAILHYLRETLRASLAHIVRLQPYHPGQVLILDSVTRRSLELTRTLRDGKREGSLLFALDRTLTPMGARLLQDWLLTPTTEQARLSARLDAVEEVKTDLPFRRRLREVLEKMPDLARLATRASTRRANPRELAAVAGALRLLPRLKAVVTGRRAALLSELETCIELCPDLRQLLDQALEDAPPIHPKEGGLIRPGYSEELDRLREIRRGGKEWIARFQAQEIARTGIPSLKVGFNKVFGYYIEVTHAHQQRIPPDYQRKQTLKNAERYITPELKSYEEQVLRAEERSQELEYEIFVNLRDQVAGQAPRLLRTAEAIAQLDVLASLAEVADVYDWTRPEVVEDPVLHIEQGRHPVVERSLPAGSFVPNDTAMQPEESLLLLITGPNMAGKSTYLRQVALIVLLAHMGSFVPARKAVIGLTDRIFTRVGASDDLARGQSTFLVEMTETANILNNATPRSLVILDEIGRGTSTYDGVSLAWAVAEYLHDQIGCRTLFATHYHELTQLADTLPRLKNCNAAVVEQGHTIVFLHQIRPGPADRSYGIHVAQLAGVPQPVLQRARQVLELLENQHVRTAAQHQAARRRRKDADHPLLFNLLGSQT
jgi:DNA mismatch repair protein MutS